MIRLKRADHIAMGAADWKRQLDLMKHLLGFTLVYDFPAGPDGQFWGGAAAVRNTGIDFEVIEPARPDGFLQRFLDERGPGLHHVTLEVHDIHETVAELERLGVEPFGGLQDDGQWLVTYIHPKESGGILWQLFVPKVEREIDRSVAGRGIVDLQRVDHVSMAAKDLDEQVEWQSRVLGMEKLNEWTDEELGYRGCNMSIPGSRLKLEIMAPTREDSFVGRFIDQRGAGMHHICCEVASVDEAVDALRRDGIEPHGGIIESRWRRHTFIHPRDSGGVLFQLFEEPKE